MSEEQNNDNGTVNESVFKNYADIKNKIKELTAQAKEIEKEVTSEMDKLGMEKINSNIGTFSFTKRKSWEYPEEVKLKEQEYKEIKKKSEEDGSAKATETKSLTFRAN